MNTKYEIISVDPKQLKVSIRYYSVDLPDYWVNVSITDFSESAIHDIAKAKSKLAERFWVDISALPDEIVLENSSGVIKKQVFTSQPDFDPFTEKLEVTWDESELEQTQVWTVVPQTENEKAHILNEFRDTASVTPRQARLELAKRGQLSNIDQIIASLPADQQEVVQIEWEYAVSIERKSPWVIQLGSALGLDEVGLDELFKAAAVL